MNIKPKFDIFSRVYTWKGKKVYILYLFQVAAAEADVPDLPSSSSRLVLFKSGAPSSVAATFAVIIVFNSFVVLTASTILLWRISWPCCQIKKYSSFYCSATTYRSSAGDRLWLPFCRSEIQSFFWASLDRRSLDRVKRHSLDRFCASLGCSIDLRLTITNPDVATCAAQVESGVAFSRVWWCRQKNRQKNKTS